MKKLDRFGEIKALYARFNKAEKDLLHAHLRSIEQLGTRGYENVSKIILAVDKDPKISREEALKNTKGTFKNNSEINTTLLLIKGYLLEQLQLEVNIERPGSYSNQFRISVSNGKKIDQARILLDRGLTGQGQKLLEEVVSRSEKYELFDQTAAALKILGFIYAVEKGVRTLKRYESYLRDARLKRDYMDKAASIYAEYRMNSNRAAKSIDGNGVDKPLESLEKIAKASNLKYPLYLLLTLKTKELIEDSQFRKAENSCMKLAEIIKDSPSLQSEERLSYVHLMLAEVQIQLRKLNAAEQTLDAASKLLKKNSYESYLVNKYQSLILFHRGDTKSLQIELPKILKSKYTLRLPYAAVQFHYYMAMLYFRTGAFKSAVKLLTDEIDIAPGINIDTALGQNVGLFMASVELIQEDEATALAGTKKALTNLEKIYESSEIRKRDKVIIRVIKRIAAREYDFSRTALLVKDSLQRLNSPNDELRWEPLSHEIVPFDQWFSSKLKSGKLKVKMPTFQKEATR